MGPLYSARGCNYAIQRQQWLHRNGKCSKTHILHLTYWYQIFLALRMGGTWPCPLWPDWHIYQYVRSSYQGTPAKSISPSWRLSPRPHSTNVFTSLSVYHGKHHQPQCQPRLICSAVIHHPTYSGGCSSIRSTSKRLSSQSILACTRAWVVQSTISFVSSIPNCGGVTWYRLVDT